MIKYILFSLLCAANLLSASNYNVGILANSDGTLGLAYVKPSFTVSVSGSIVKNATELQERETTLNFSGFYKKEITANTKVKLGGRYSMITEKTSDDDDSDEHERFAVIAGLDYQLNDRVILYTETDLYYNQINDDVSDETGVFNSGRVGIYLLF